jgi:hypothetical protein
MNITIYIALAIVLILIIFYFCFRQYLIKTQSTTITVNDNSPITHSCIYDKHTKILMCNYLINAKKIVFLDMINKIISDWDDSLPFVFKSSDYNLEAGGVLKIRFICNKKNNFKNSIQKKYDHMEKEYRAHNNNSPLIPIHSSSTQNPNKHFPQLYNYGDDVSDFLAKVDTSIKYNNLDSMLTDIEKNENSASNSFVKDSPNSYYSNIFSRKYPKNSVTSKLAKIDSEYILGGLKGDARLLD